MQVKISDFGLSREGVEYKMDLAKKVPIRWLPPETIRSGYYTPKTDVFAFGIMSWEITEDGKEPYPGMKVIDVAMKVLAGYRQPFGSDVNVSFANFIKDKCYPEKYEERASMKEVVKWMRTFLKSQDTGKSGVSWSLNFQGFWNFTWFSRFWNSRNFLSLDSERISNFQRFWIFRYFEISRILNL